MFSTYGNLGETIFCELDSLCKKEQRQARVTSVIGGIFFQNPRRNDEAQKMATQPGLVEHHSFFLQY